jgi:photosynthetic reaction center H subunit
MDIGAITGYIDVAQIVLYVFIAFFLGLVYYLHQEDKREGYPLESERSAHITVQGYPPIPAPKTFKISETHSVQVPRAGGGADRRSVAATAFDKFPGSPLVPTGNPMLDGVGPASYAERSDTPDLTVGGAPKLVPLRLATAFHLDARDPDPRGMTVVGADGATGGTVTDVWVDQGEYIIRYYEVDTGGNAGDRKVLLPATMVRVSGKKRQVSVVSILGSQFGAVPRHKSADRVTRLEEDRICAYYASGHLYATPARSEPVI